MRAELRHYARPRDAAAHLKISYCTLYRLLKKDPTFPRPVKIGAATVFDLNEIDAWMARLR